MAETEQPSGGPPTVAYSGAFGEAWKLAIKTTFLTAVTLGVYRFWAKTRLRRYFWSRIAVAGEPLEYDGTGLELFLGFLVVILIMAPLYAAIGWGQLYAAETPVLALALQGVPLLLLLALIPVAVYRARRYRLSRTVWRGIRGGLAGSTWGYWKRALLYGLVGWLTLGLLRPLAHVRLTRYLMGHTRFGSGRFGFDARVRDLMVKWLLAWVPGVLTTAAYFGFLVSAGIAATEADPTGEMQNLDILRGLDPDLIGLGGGGVSLLALCAFVFYIRYQLHMVRTFARATTFEGLAFATGIRFWRIVGIFAALFAVYAASIAIAVAIGFALAPAFVALFAVVGVFFAATLFAPMATHPLLRHFVETLKISGRIDLDALNRGESARPRAGEGLASVFDVDAF